MRVAKSSTIGANVTIGQFVSLLAYLRPSRRTDGCAYGLAGIHAGLSIEIEDDVWIGAQVVSWTGSESVVEPSLELEQS